MSHPTPLDYAPPTRTYRKSLHRAATASLAFPLLLPTCLYAQWLLSWALLGHPPRPSFDDPGQIAGASWLHALTTIALVLAFPSAFAALWLNLAHVIVNRPPAPRATARLALLVLSWTALTLLLQTDPGGVVNWWMD